MKSYKVFFILVFLSLSSTQILEVKFLPIAIYIKEVVYGEQSFTYANTECQILAENKNKKWVHPATLSLTVYSQTQQLLNQQHNLYEVLPHYASQYESNDIACVAKVLINESEKHKSGSSYYSYQVDKPIYNLYDEWYSGLAQSFAGQVMLATYLKTNDDDYLEMARKLAHFLEVEVKNDGVLLKKSSNEFWYVEYASKNVSPPEVLNGHLLALDFLYWMSIYDERYSDKWKSLFERGLKAVLADIEDYTGIFWSYYDKEGTLANGKYHRFHIAQLERYKAFDSSGRLESAQHIMELQLYFPSGVLYRLLTQPSNLLWFIFSFFMIFYSFIYYGFLIWKRKK